MHVSWGIRSAALLCWCAGVGFGLPCLPTVRELLAGRGLPMILGFRAYGGGAFEGAGVRTMVALLLVFQLVCVLECVAGWLLWGGHRTGAVLALALIPVGAVFWWGFVLPFAPPPAVVRTILIILLWGTLT